LPARGLQRLAVLGCLERAFGWLPDTGRGAGKMYS
jgi:hypothetical protein